MVDVVSSRPAPPKMIEDRSMRHIHVKKYKVVGHLGRGGFANVYRVQSIDSSKIYACKIITKSKLTSHEHQRKLVSEIQLHRSLQHQNIVRYERHFEDKKNVYILLECCPNGSLMELSIKRGKLTEHEVRFFMKDILVAIKYLHSIFIIHRDLKLGNILLDKNLKVKICDFGLAAKLQYGAERKTTICGTPNYTAPEILNHRKSGEGHSYEVDVWSIGVIMFTLLTGKPPFETKNIKETYRRIRKIKYQFPNNSDQYITSQAKGLISQIFTKDPNRRPNLYQISQHSFFKQLPIPKSLPLFILRRNPTYHELFPHASNSTSTRPIISSLSSSSSPPSFSSSSSSSRPPLVSTGYVNNNNNTNNNNSNHKNNKNNNNNIKSYSNNNNYGNNEDEDEDDDICLIKKEKKKEEKTEKIDDKKMKKEKEEKKEDMFVSIIKYVDYTKKYGMGYILSNGCTGIYFNDSTKIVLYENKRNVLYVDHLDCKTYCLMTSFPSFLKKKIKLLKHFTEYLWKTSTNNENNTNCDYDINEKLNELKQKNNNNNINDKKEEDKIYMKTTVSDQYCHLWKFSNNMVQVNFTDNSQIMILNHLCLYKDKQNKKHIYHLNEIDNSNRKDLKKRCKYTQQLLEKIAAKNNKYQ